MADIKNFGIKGIAADVQMGKSGGRLKYDSSNNRFDLTQSDGSTLEDLRLGSVTSGTWTGSAIGTAYGGTGIDLSSSTGTLRVSSGTVSAGAIDLSDSSFVTGALSVANGGTGATAAAGARTNLGLGTIATQAANAIDIDGGSIDGTVIGGNTAAAITGSTITANTGFVGDLTGTADDANGLSSAVTVAVSGDATGTATFQNAGDTATISTTLATVNSDVGQVGSTTNVPVLTINAKGLVTAVSTASIATGLNIAADTGSTDAVAGGETITFEGGTNIDTTVSDNKISIAIQDAPTLNDLTVTGTFTSDDITSSTVNVSGDAVITGNLTVQGTQTIVESATVSTNDPIIRVNGNGTTGTDVGLEANVGGVMKQFIYDGASSKWTVGSENIVASRFEGAVTGAVTGDVTGDLTGDVKASDASVMVDSSAKTFTGDLTGDVTGQVSSIANHDTGDLTEDPSATVSSGTMYYTDARVQTKVDSYVTGGNAISIASGVVSLDNTAATPGTYGSSTQIPAITVDQQGRVTAVSQSALSTAWTLTADSGSQTIDGGDTVDVQGGTNITTAVSATDVVDVSLDPNISLTIVTASGAVEGGSITDGTATLASGSITSGVAATFSGAVEGGSLTDGTATLSSGALSGATTGAFSGNVSAGNIALTGEVAGSTADFSGQVDFGSLSDGTITINGFVDEDNMNSDSASLIPTQQSVKAYVDSQLTATDLDFQGDTGGALSIDLDTESLTIAGGTNLNSAGSGNTLTLNLDSTLTGLTAVTSSQFTGPLTGDVTGDVTGDLTGKADTADALETARHFAVTGDATATATAFDGTANVTLSTTLATVNSDTGTHGSTTAIPVVTVNAKGLVTAVSTATISTDLDIAGDSGTDTVNLDVDTLTFEGTSNEIVTAVTDNKVTVGFATNPTINNLTATGTFTSDDITSASIGINGDAVISGNLTVQGTQTIVNSTTVEAADPIFRVNTAGANTDSGFEANVNGSIKQILYTAAGTEWDFGTEDIKTSGNFIGDVTGNADTAATLETTRAISITGDATATVNFNGSQDVALATTLATVNSDVGSYGSVTAIPVITVNAKGLVTGVSTAAISTAITVAGDTGGNQTVENGDTLSILGGTNINTAGSATDTMTINLDSTLTGLTSVTSTTLTDGTASLNSGSLTGVVGVTASGTVQFGSLSDGAITATAFESTITDSDTVIPTSGAVVDHVRTSADGLLLRASFTADSSASSFNIGTMPNVTGRTYYANKLVIKVTTAFSGDSVNAIKITEDGTSGSTLVAIDDADCTTIGTYNVELDGDIELTKNAAITVSFVKADGSTASVPTAGVLKASAHYNFV